MPTVLRWNGYRFYFFSNEGTEPPHIHVDRAGATAKFWLSPILLARNHGYSERDLRVIQSKIEEQQLAFIETWNGRFGSRT